LEWSGLVLLVVGWLLGMLSPAVIELIATKRKLEPIKKQVRIECDELSRQLIIITFLCAKDTSSLDVELITWCRAELNRVGSNCEGEEISEILKDLSKSNSSQIQAINNAQRDKEFEGRSLKKYELPYTMAHTTFIHNFDIETQSIIWEVTNRIQILNQEIDSVREYMFLTFDESISSDNNIRIVNDIKRKYVFISKSCRAIVNVARKLS